MTFPSLQIAAKPNVTISFGAVRVVCKLTLTVVAILNLLTFEALGSARIESPVINPLDPQAIITQTTRSVRPGDSVEGELEGNKSESFSVPLVAGRFVKFRIEQHGMTLQVTLLDPNGTQVIQMDAPAGGYGPIMFSAIAATSGDYRLELKSTNAWALKYKYEIFIDRDRAVESQDALQISAEKAFSEGRKSWKKGDRASAIRSYEVANDFWKNTEDHHWQAVVQYALSEAYRDSDNLKSKASLEETLRILNIEMAPNDWRLKASALNDLGTIHRQLGPTHIEQANDLLNQAIALYASHKDLRGQASSLNQLAMVQYRSNNLSRARELILQALDLRRTVNDKEGISNLINALGVIADALGEPDEALKYAKESLQNWQAIGEIQAKDKKRYAGVFTTLAAATDKLGQWDQALDYYDKALEIYDQEDAFRAVTLSNKGELYVVLGDPAKAKDCYDQALEIMDAAKPDVDDKAALLIHIGQLQIIYGEIESSIKTFEEGLSLKPSITRQADLQTNLAAVYVQKGELQKALDIYDSILKLQTGQSSQPRSHALTLQKRGEAYALSGRPDQALNDLRAALPLWQSIKDQRGEAATLNSIARVEQGRGNLLAALTNNTEAIRIVESLRTNISSYQLRTSYFSTQENYYELDVDLKMQLSKNENRTEYLAAALESNEKARARVLLESLNEAGVGRIADSGNSDPRFSSLIEEKLKLLVTLAAKAQARTRFLSGPHSPEQIARLDRELTELNTKYDDLETTIRSENPRFATLTKPTPASLAQIQQQLDSDTLLIEFLLGERRSYAWVVGTNAIAGTELPARREIQNLAKRVSIALSERGRTVKNESERDRQQRIRIAESDYGEASSLLSKAVLAPIASLLTKKRLVIVADGILQLLPFEALPYPDQLIAGARPAQPLIEKHEIVTLPSASVLVLQRRELKDRKPAPYALAVIADPVFGKLDNRVTTSSKDKKPAQAKPTDNEAGAGRASQLSRALEDVGMQSASEIRRLPFSLTEAKAILETVPANQSFSALSFEANRKTVMDPKLSRYRIVHLATHGVMDLTHPELSGVLLSMVDKNGKEQNGYLGLNEIYNLNWPAELVVLSACETGVGKEVKGEGLITLTRGFMYAGAARVVASLWKVNDRATAELMAEFYRQMVGNKTPPAAALRAAQLKLAHTPRWKNPHFWAGFVLQGEWQ